MLDTDRDKRNTERGKGLVNIKKLNAALRETTVHVSACVRGHDLNTLPQPGRAAACTAHLDRVHGGGDTTALRTYADAVTTARAAYEQGHRAVHAHEARWTQRPFWARRRSDPTN